MSDARPERVAPLRVGVAGLGTISRQIIEGIGATEGFVLSAAADIRSDAREAFERDHGRRAFDSVDAMCADGQVDVVWIATPNPFHCVTSLAALRRRKHVVCEKPLAVTLAQCDAMVREADRAGVLLVQGHSKIFDPPVRAMRDLIDEGELGAVLQIDSWMFNDWLQRPRLAAELDVAQGGGVVMRQGPHMVDIARYLAGGRIRSVKAVSGNAGTALGGGNFTALLEFDTGAVASLSFNGYGHFDISELTGGVGVSGRRASLEDIRRVRPRRVAALQSHEKFGAAMETAPARATGVGERLMPFFGLTIVSCERGVVRQSAEGLLIHGEDGVRALTVPPTAPGLPELHELRAALADNRPAFPDARWGRATVEACLGILKSAAHRRTMPMRRQAPQTFRPEVIP